MRLRWQAHMIVYERPRLKNCRLQKQRTGRRAKYRPGSKPEVTRHVFRIPYSIGLYLRAYSAYTGTAPSSLVSEYFYEQKVFKGLVLSLYLLNR